MDFNTKLIGLVKNHKFLYDPNDSRGDIVRKEETWKAISKMLQVPVSDCKKSWVLLREGLRRTLKKQMAAESDPVQRTDKASTKWVYEDDLAFLAPYLKNHRVPQKKDDVVKEKTDKQASPDNTEVLGRKRSREKRSRPHEGVGQKSSSQEPLSDSILKYLLEKTTNRDDIEQFFDSIASTVKWFSPRDKIIAKARVFAVISQMELEILNRKTVPFHANSLASYEAEVTYYEEAANLSCEVTNVTSEVTNATSEATNATSEVTNATSEVINATSEVTKSNNDAPSPNGGPAIVLLDSENSSDDEMESSPEDEMVSPEDEIKVEPEEILGLKIKPEI